MIEDQESLERALVLSKEEIEFYLEAGRIASEVRRESSRMVEVGIPLITICDNVEQAILDKGGNLAFPCNVCINDVAAHYSSPPEDKTIIPTKSIVKIDLGVHVDGYIADTAFSVCFDNSYEPLIRATDEALENALKMLRPGILTLDIGKTIQETIEKWGFKPVWNLTGHQMGKYNLHMGKTVPNVPRFNPETLFEGDVCAIEPFATLSSGAGEVVGRRDSHIYKLNRRRPPKSSEAKQLFTFISEEFKTLPFSQRWLRNFQQNPKFNQSFKELIRTRRIRGYPVLVEKTGKPVSQTEHTAIITDNGCIITTK